MNRITNVDNFTSKNFWIILVIPMAIEHLNLGVKFHLEMSE